MDLTRGRLKSLVVVSDQYTGFLNTRDLPIGSPSLGMGKRGNESAARCINMDRNIDARPILVLIENLRNLLDWLVVPGICAAENNKHANGVLVNVLSHEIGVQPELALRRHGEDAGFHLKVARKLLEGHLGIGTHDDVWLERVLALGASELLPAPLHGQSAEVDGL